MCSRDAEGDLDDTLIPDQLKAESDSEDDYDINIDTDEEHSSDEIMIID